MFTKFINIVCDIIWGKRIFGNNILCGIDDRSDPNGSIIAKFVNIVNGSGVADVITSEFLNFNISINSMMVGCPNGQIFAKFNGYVDDSDDRHGASTASYVFEFICFRGTIIFIHVLCEWWDVCLCCDVTRLSNADCLFELILLFVIICFVSFCL